MTTAAQTFNSPLWSYDPSAALLVRDGPGSNTCMLAQQPVQVAAVTDLPPSTEPPTSC